MDSMNGPHLLTRPPISINIASTKVPFKLWHSFLGHPQSTILNFVLKKIALPIATTEKVESCNACSYNKAQRFPFQRLTLSTNVPLQVNFAIYGDHPLFYY